MGDQRLMDLKDGEFYTKSNFYNCFTNFTTENYDKIFNTKFRKS